MIKDSAFSFALVRMEDANSPAGAHEIPSVDERQVIVGKRSRSLHSNNFSRQFVQSLSQLHIDDSQDEDDIDSVAMPEFDPRRCLFCNHTNAHLEASLEHMRKKHRFFIQDEAHLAVDLHTIVEYFHLVVFGYSECLYCGSQRRNPEATQQHMIGKGHCKIDISDEESEFRDFYDFGSASENSDDDADKDGEEGSNRIISSKAPVVFVDPDEKTIRLASGKMLSHRSNGKPRPNRRKLPHAAPASTEEQVIEDGSLAGTNSSSDSIGVRASASALTRSAKREVVFEKQLANLRAEDRRSLMHLPAPQQRALLAKAKAQVERARKEENEMKLKIQLKANKSSKK